MFRQRQQLVDVGPGVDEVGVVTLRRVVNIANTDSDGHTRANTGHERVLLCETRQLVEESPGAERRSVSQETLVGLVRKTVSDNRAALGDNRLTEFARPLASE